jgi:hypothetical protein
MLGRWLLTGEGWSLLISCCYVQAAGTAPVHIPGRVEGGGFGIAAQDQHWTCPVANPLLSLAHLHRLDQHLTAPGSFPQTASCCPCCPFCMLGRQVEGRPGPAAMLLLKVRLRINMVPSPCILQLQCEATMQALLSSDLRQASPPVVDGERKLGLLLAESYLRGCTSRELSGE